MCGTNFTAAAMIKSFINGTCLESRSRRWASARAPSMFGMSVGSKRLPLACEGLSTGCVLHGHTLVPAKLKKDPGWRDGRIRGVVYRW
jgi:hypothetical protein